LVLDYCPVGGIGEVGLTVVDEDAALAISMVDHDVEVEITVDVGEVEIDGSASPIDGRLTARGGRGGDGGRKRLVATRERWLELGCRPLELPGAVVGVEN